MRVVILDNLRSAFNVGSVFRTAAALEYDEVALCGVSISPPSPKLRDTSRGCETRIPWRSFDTTEQAVQHYRTKGATIVALETGAGGVPIHTWKSCVNLAWVLGNEAMGVSPHILEKMDEVVELPLTQSMTGINVSCAFAAAAYYDGLRALPQAE